MNSNAFYTTKQIRGRQPSALQEVEQIEYKIEQALAVSLKQYIILKICLKATEVHYFFHSKYFFQQKHITNALFCIDLATSSKLHQNCRGRTQTNNFLKTQKQHRPNSFFKLQRQHRPIIFLKLQRQNTGYVLY